MSNSANATLKEVDLADEVGGEESYRIGQQSSGDHEDPKVDELGYANDVAQRQRREEMPQRTV